MANRLPLYHGSGEVVRHPNPGRCRDEDDYGRAFYCTFEREMACEWACRATRGGFANAYALDMDGSGKAGGLAVPDPNGPGYCILHWLSVLVAHRGMETGMETARQAAQWLVGNFPVDVDSADIVKGYRADDSHFSFARGFLRNSLTLDQLQRAMRLGKLGEQYAVKSDEAFSALSFLHADPVKWETYWPLRASRDEAARRGFRRLAAEEAQGDAQGIRIVDLMRMEEDELHARLF